MSCAVFVLRPEPGFFATMQAGHHAGLTMIGQPLFEVQPLEWSAPDPVDYDGVLLGSANAIRHGGAELAKLCDLPAFVVGKTTAEAARDAGFSVAATGAGGLQNLLDDLPEEGPKRLLRLSGADHVDLLPPAGTQIDQRIIYESRAVPIGADLALDLTKGGIVLLHSARAAEHFKAECGRLNIDTQTLTLATLGPRIDAAAGGAEWASIHHCDVPEDAALLALAGRLCKKMP